MTDPEISEAAMESALRKLEQLAQRFEDYKKKTNVQDEERDRERGLIAAEFSHILMLAINWVTLAQMDPKGLVNILKVIPVGTWSAAFKTVKKENLRAILIGLSDANYDVLAELLTAYPPSKIARTLSDAEIYAKVREALEMSEDKWQGQQ